MWFKQSHGTDLFAGSRFLRGCEQPGRLTTASEKLRSEKLITKMLPGHEDLRFKERLGKLGLHCKECKRMRADLIELYKITRGIEC